MNYSNLARIALLALLRNKMRTFLTMLGIIIGVASVITMLAIGQGSKQNIQKQVSSMGSNLLFVMPGSQERGGVQMGNSLSQKLTLQDIDAITSQCPSVTMVSPEVRSSGQVIYDGKNAHTSIYGVNQKYLDIKKIGLKTGDVFTEKDIKSAAKVGLIGSTVIKNLFENENFNPVGLTIRFNNIPMKIIGVLEKKGQNNFGQDQDDMIIAPYSMVQKRILAFNHVQAIYASAISENKTQKAVKEIEYVLRIKHKLKESDENDFTVRSQEELVKMFSSISDVLTILLGAIAGISLLVGGVGIMNIMYVSVTERTREIGLRMSIGGQEKDILMQFLTESIFLSVLGGLIGIMLGIITSRIIADIMHWPVAIMPQAVIFSFLVCTLIGIFFGWYPARKAASLDPIDALRYE
jgi:putative ABC transport system permease protein